MRVTWRQYAQQVQQLAAGLASLGVRRGDTVGLMLTNRPEFHLLDTAVLHTGATPFSVYNTFPPAEIAHLFGNAGNRVVICEQQFLDGIRAATAATDTSVQHIVCIDAEVEGTISLDDLASRTADGFDFAKAWQAVEPSDVLTIIYTSGTTGPPKGVELTHANMLAELAATTGIMPITADDSVISYLPDAHIANRWAAHYNSLLTGIQVVTLADLRQMITVLPDVRPTFFGAVPQIYYKLKAVIEAQLAAESSPVKKRLAMWAINVGRARARLLSDGKPAPFAIRAQHALAGRLVLPAVRSRFGLDRVKFAACGAAALDPKALEFMLGLGLTLCELWGMSEMCGTATINPPDAIRIGTVGTALPGVELRIADDGELLVRGPIVMKGYRNEPTKTAEAIDADGWLRTGDIATVDDAGYVRIIDRKKELMINAARAAIEVGIKDANSRLARVEQIKKFTILPAVWKPGGDEVTPTMKLKRKPIAAKYAEQIEALYRN